ncbi:HNH endonuclease signature motif containing protein [Amycolatopsis taiwanensis]|uniref:HNH endonuclease signature motif containing protein n=1 Tax=Amycolatopsis taiwanensis TaxID=342230 RepID=UPI003CCB9920
MNPRRPCTGEACSTPLDIGRAARVVPRSIRRALNQRDRGCTFPNCTKRPKWTHAHHVAHWAVGGPTSLQNLTLLCHHHHRLIHHSAWVRHEALVVSNGGGRPSSLGRRSDLVKLRAA